MSSRGRIVISWLLGGFLAGLAILPLCDLHFDCGCRWPGLGGWRHCDIHTAGPPDCPWCEHAAVFGVVMALSYALALAGVFRLRHKVGTLGLALVSLGVVLACAVLAGILTSLILGRPVLAGL